MGANALHPSMNSFTLAQALLLASSCLLLAFVPASSRPSLSHNPASPPACRSIDAMYAFGDSTTDTGNAVLTGSPGFQIADRAPYGNTFGRPTGRFSDGKLIVDYLCDDLGVNLLPPHLQENGGGSQNFAVAGATALEPNELQQYGGVSSPSSYSLGTEMGWFHNAVTSPLTEKSVIYFGEIGGNDVNYAFASGKPPAEAAKLIPHVMDKVNSSLESIVAAGAQRIVVQGNFPMGCLPTYLKRMSGEGLDQHGCVQSISAVSDQHNSRLLEVLKDVQARHSGVELVYLDTTAAYLHVLDHASEYGFSNVADACLNSSPLLLQKQDANKTASNRAINAAGGTCSDPRTYISWDGIHLTGAMYHTLMDLFVHNGFSSPSPSFIGACAS